jgi:hypothetical protein
MRHSAIASSICSFQVPGDSLGDSPKGETMFFFILDQASELAAGKDQFEIGVLAEFLPIAGAVECFEPDTRFRGLSRSANRRYAPRSSRCWDRKYAW